MSWQLALVALIVVNTASVVLTKVAADRLPKKSIGLFFQYLICAILTIGFAVFTGKSSFNSTLLLIAGVGFINAFGNYFQWHASAISLSKTTLFFPLMEVSTIVLAMLFLQEIALWNFQLIVGASLCFAAMWLFKLPQKNSNTAKETILGSKWLFSIVAMILIFGIAGFLLKVFSFTVPRESFLMSWYAGAFVASLPILVLEKQNPFNISRKVVLIVAPVALAIIGALLMLYWTYQLGGPVSLVLPIRGIAIALIPVFLGWRLFHEKKGLSRKEWIGFLTGACGATLVLLR
ncbi:MAG: hypothetical protein Q7S60_05205 [bacterium]|nr:hypothetical protein [bacterium]